MSQVFRSLSSACGAITGLILNSQVFSQFAWDRRTKSFYAVLIQFVCEACVAWHSQACIATWPNMQDEYIEPHQEHYDAERKCQGMALFSDLNFHSMTFKC